MKLNNLILINYNEDFVGFTTVTDDDFDDDDDCLIPSLTADILFVAFSGFVVVTSDD